MPKNLLFSLSDQIFVSGGNFLTLVICANGLTVSGQGKLSYVIICYMALALFNIASIFNGASVLINEQSNKEKYRKILFVYQVLAALFTSALLTSALFFAGNYIGWKIESVELILVALFLFTQQIVDFDRRIKYICENEKSALLSSVRVYPVRIILLTIFLPSSIKEALELLVLANLFASILVIIKQSSHVTKYFSRESVTVILAHLKFSKLIILSALMGWLWSYLPTIFLGYFYGKGLVGILVTLRSITNVANVLMEQVETVSSVVFARKAYKHGEDELGSAVTKILISGTGIWVCGVIVLYFFGHGIVLNMLGQEYANYSGLLVIMWLGFGIYFIARVFAIKYRSLKNLKIEFLSGLSSLLMALVCIPLISQYSIVGTAWAYVFISLSAVLVQWILIKYLKLKKLSVY